MTDTATVIIALFVAIVVINVWATRAIVPDDLVPVFRLLSDVGIMFMAIGAALIAAHLGEGLAEVGCQISRFLVLLASLGIWTFDCYSTKSYAGEWGVVLFVFGTTVLLYAVRRLRDYTKNNGKAKKLDG